MSEAEPTIVPPEEKPWGFYENGAFVEIPKLPLTQAGLAAPCTVRLWDGRHREIIEKPE